MPGSGKDTHRERRGCHRESGHAHSSAQGRCHLGWGVCNVLFRQTHSLRLNLRCVSEVEFDPCRQLIWTFLAWIICLAVSPDQINWIIAKPLLSCAPLGSWCSQQDGVGLQGQARLENEHMLATWLPGGAGSRSFDQGEQGGSGWGEGLIDGPRFIGKAI